jgi:redox-sensing transcriptional repressor
MTDQPHPEAERRSPAEVNAGPPRTAAVPSERGAVPPATVSRLWLYLRQLRQLRREGGASINSQQLAASLGISGAQVRRDLALFGHFGKRGVGYPLESLERSIKAILGMDQRWPVMLIGVGNLGTALAGYSGLAEQGFHLVAALDSDPRRVGQPLGQLIVEPVELLEQIVPERHVQLAMLAVPAPAAEALGRRLLGAGVRGILNFAPISLRGLTPQAPVVEVDLAMEIQRLAFAVANRPPSH